MASDDERPIVRRRRDLILAGLGSGALGIAAPIGAALTPRQPRGPFYPRELPLDQDNDLTRVVGEARTAAGEIVDVEGRVVDESGRALSGVTLEIWQANAYGRYHHRWDRSDQPWDPGFQGYGRTTTDDAGNYRFRTIKPVPYPGRTPHIHVALSGSGIDGLTTQMYLAGHPQNRWDPLLARVSSEALREQLLVDFQAVEGRSVPMGRFDLVLAGDGRLSLLGAHDG